MAIESYRKGGCFLPDGEDLLNRWIEFGSLQKVAKYYEESGLVNPLTGKRVSRQAIHQRILTWAFKSDENLQKLRKAWSDGIISKGLPEPSEEKWRDYVVSRLINRGHPTIAAKFLQSHPEYRTGGRHGNGK